MRMEDRTVIIKRPEADLTRAPPYVRMIKQKTGAGFLDILKKLSPLLDNPIVKALELPGWYGRRMLAEKDGWSLRFAAEQGEENRYIVGNRLIICSFDKTFRINRSFVVDDQIPSLFFECLDSIPKKSIVLTAVSMRQSADPDFQNFGSLKRLIFKGRFNDVPDYLFITDYPEFVSLRMQTSYKGPLGKWTIRTIFDMVWMLQNGFKIDEQMTDARLISSANLTFKNLGNEEWVQSLREQKEAHTKRKT